MPQDESARALDRRTLYMTDEQLSEYSLLSLANESGKFAIGLRYVLSEEAQLALERLQLRRWVTLIDVTVVEHSRQQVVRVFLASEEAMKWRRTGK